MRKLLAPVCVMLSMVILFCGSVCAGEVLDRLLNQMVIDAQNDGPNRKDYKSITSENPIGQTFATGPNIVEISRVAVAVAYWNEEWTKDESLVLTLWDSPRKTARIASQEMPYKWKDWEGSVAMFTLNANVKPSTKYYFELTVNGGNGSITGVFTGEKYDGTAYEGGKPVDKNIFFQIHGRVPFDRDKLYSEMLSKWDMNYPGLEKVKAAYQAKNWDKAVDELIAYYEARPDLVDPDDVVKVDPKYDRSYNDLVVKEMKIKVANDEIVDLGPNWNHYRTWPTRGGVGLTRSGIMGQFRGGYLKTGDEMFAAKFSELMASMIENQPSPLRAGAIAPGRKGLNPAPPTGIMGGSMWAGLSIGARMNQMWYYYSGLHSSPNFTRDARAAMIFNMVNMIDVLSIQKGGGNWDTQMSTALYEAADRHPELKMSGEWIKESMAAIFDNLMTVSRADGPTQEPTSNYHTLMLNRFLRILENCREKNISVDPKYVKRVEKIVEYTMYATQPDWRMASTGDTFNYKDALDLLMRGAKYFNRSDFLYVATKGLQGTPPAGTSCQFPIMGWFVMRSDWTPDARFLYLHNGDNLGHGHADELQTVISAYGSAIVVDPGCYIYGTPKQTELSKTRRHPTVTVDMADTVTQKGKSQWVSMNSADLYIGTNAGYRGLDGVTHTRKIAFLKPDYWVISDTANGSGEHEVTVNYPFAKDIAAVIDPATGNCRTNNAAGNMVIAPVADSAFKGECYETDFPRGDRLYPAQALKYSAKLQLPATFAAALVPFKGKNAPKASVTSVAPDCYKVDLADGTDYVCFAGLTTSDVTFGGDALVLRTGSRGLKSAVWLNGLSVSYKGQEIAYAAKPVGKLELVWDGDLLTISGDIEPSLKIKAMGAKRFRVGYGPVREVNAAVIEPYN